MRTKKIANFAIKPPKKSAFTIETPPDIPKLHTLMMISSRRGCGKTTSLTNYIRKLQDLKLIDEVYLITPTYYSNKEMWDTIGITTENVLEPTQTVLSEITKRVENERAEWDAYLDKKKKWETFKKMSENHIPLNKLKPELMIEFMDLGFFDANAEKPQWKYEKEVPPRLFLAVDDFMGTALCYPRAGLTDFCLRHRHIGKGLGISVAMLVQSYCAVGGVPRPIRENVTVLMLGRNNQEGQIEKIYSECIGNECSKEEFLKAFEYATAEPYSFFLIDFSPKSKAQRFRKNFDTYIEIGEVPPQSHPQ